MSIPELHHDLSPQTLPLYESLKEGMRKIPGDLTIVHMKKAIASKFIGFRSDRSNCIILNELTYIIILRYYHGRYNDTDDEELLHIYKCKNMNRSVIFELNNLPERLIKMLYVLSESIKNK